MIKMKDSTGVSARPTLLSLNTGQLLSKDCQEDQEGINRWDDQVQEPCVNTA